MGETIKNTPGAQLPQIPRPRLLTNTTDVSRKWPTAALADEVVTEAEQEATVIDQIRRSDTTIQFNPFQADLFGATLPSATVKVAVTNDQGVIDKLTDIELVQVDIETSTAPGKKLKFGSKLGVVDGSLFVKLDQGEALVELVPTGNGTFKVGLDNAFNNALVNASNGRAFDVTDTATATFS